MFISSQHLAGVLHGFIFTALLCLTGLFALGAVFSSYQFELMGYTALLGEVGQSQPLEALDLTVAEILAIGLNGGKIMLIFICVDMAVRYAKPAIAAKLLRALVLLLSLAMTLLVFGGQAISPMAQANLEEARATIEQTYQERVDVLTAQQNSRQAAISDRTEQDVLRLTAAHATRLDELEALLDAERLVGNQNFRGNRYIELESMIEKAKADYLARVDDLRALERTEISALTTSVQSQIIDADSTRQSRLDQLSFGSSFLSQEAQHPYLLRAAEMVRVFLPEHADHVKVTIALAFLLCFAVELLPMVLFNHLFLVLAEQRMQVRKVDEVAFSVNAPANSQEPPSQGGEEQDTERKRA